tara:strand:+ start:3277 stop:3684 length:408 start_codon:yes stop_codon:yes gene_type:complete
MDDKWINEVINANSDKGFVRRILDPSTHESIKNDDGTVSSHSMAYSSADGKFFVYPTVVVGPDGKLQRLSSDDAWDNSVKTGNAIAFDDEDRAAFFSKNYKRMWEKDFLIKDHTVESSSSPHIMQVKPQQTQPQQ